MQTKPSARPPQYAARRNSVAVRAGHVVIGGNAPVVAQSMTDTDTANAKATAAQCAELARAGAELVRITVNTPKAARAVAEVRARLDDEGITAPLVGDFHFNGHKLLAQSPQCASALAKYRINPGNVGRGHKHDANFASMIGIAKDNDKAVRIGVNWGSLDQELLTRLMDENAKSKTPASAGQILRRALVESALQSAHAAEALGLARSRIVLSCKTSRIPDLLAVYRELARSPYALHIGLTEAGMGARGVAASAAALGILLAEGIGDTVRASLTPAVGGSRADEVRLCCDLLQAMQLRAFAPQVAACPGCGRTTSDFFRRLAADIERHIAANMPVWKRQYAGVENYKIAVMGCIVNGPGESQHANIGISLPGSGERPVAPVYIDGKKATALKGDNIAQEFVAILEEDIAKRFGGGGAAAAKSKAKTA